MILRKRWKFVVAWVAFALLLLAFGIVHWCSPSAQMKRVNVGNGQSLSDWKVFGGAWQIHNGLIRNNSDDRGAKILTGSSAWSDYSLSSELHFDGQYGDLGMIVRTTHAEEGADSYDGYYVGLRTVDGMLVIGRSDFGWIEMRPIPMPGGVHANGWYRISVTVVGCHLAAMSENLSTGQRAYAALKDEDCLAHGQVGLRSFATGGTWRNLQVHPASLAEYSEMAAKAGPLRTLELPRREDDYNRDYHFSASDQKPTAPTPVTEEVEEALPHIADVNNYARGGRYSVKLRGVVTLISPSIYIQDSDGAILVEEATARRLNLGDTVEVTGLAEPRRFANRIHATAIKLLWAGTTVPPIEVTPAQAASAAYDAKFVETEARLVAENRDKNGNLVLELTDGSQSFRALLNAQIAQSMPNFEVNSLLRIRGICVLNRELTGDLTPFVLLPRTADDVQVMAAPPWWTPWHASLLVGMLLILVVVAQQSYYRMHQWRANAVIQERERLAHEIHDTMAQSFAGVGYQIQGVRARVLKGERVEQTQIADQLSVAYQLVRRCHEEASRTITMLGTSSPEAQTDLLGALRATAQRIAGSAIDVKTRVEGEVYPLPLRCANALQMMGQEAISNALGHGEATALELTLRICGDQVELTLQDNGAGFDTERKYKGFGIQGMQKRARDIAGTLDISSQPGQGTTIRILAPMKRESALDGMVLRRLRSWRKSLQNTD